MKLKYSRYNNIIKLDDLHIIYNSFTGAVLTLNETYYNYFLHFSELTDENILDQFYSQGILVNEETDEYLRIRNYKRDKSYLYLTITPTISCNFNCNYCFEKNKKQAFMSKTVADQIPIFIKDNFPECDKIFITWFGGEPTLAIDKIEYITHSIKQYLDIKTLTQSIVTNGFLLNKNIVDRLKKIGISDVQITLDGGEKFHDSRRFLQNHEPTYRKILENIVYTSKYLNTVIRVNVDKANIMSTEKLLDDLYNLNLNRKITVYLAPIRYDNIDVSNLLELKDKKDFSNFSGFYRKAIEKNFNVELLPQLKHVRCEAVSNNGYVITPSGNLCCCWEEVDQYDPVDNSLNIFNFKRENSLKHHWQHLTNEPKKCRKCSIYPVCRCGCPKLQHETGHVKCDLLKFNINEYIKLFLQANR